MVTVFPLLLALAACEDALLIHDLGAESLKARHWATRTLIGQGPAVLPLLREATRGPNLERARRAALCISMIEHDPTYSAAKAELMEMYARHVALARRAEAFRGHCFCRDAELAVQEHTEQMMRLETMLRLCGIGNSELRLLKEEALRRLR